MLSILINSAFIAISLLAVSLLFGSRQGWLRTMFDLLMSNNMSEEASKKQRGILFILEMGVNLVLWIYWNFPGLLFCDTEEPTRKGNPELLKSSNIMHDADVPFFQFIYYKERNLLPTTLTHLAHKDNLILLCANCETEFDNSMPALTFILIITKIEYFIDYDYERRTVAASSGDKKPRTAPSGQGSLRPFSCSVIRRW
jgi:hypothetical protein